MTRYGRCMSKKEARELCKTKVLRDHGAGLVPVFYSPKHIEDRLKSMSKDRLATYFRNNRS